MACRHYPDPAFLRRLDTTLGEGRYQASWDHQRGCHVIVWRWRNSGPFRMSIRPNEQDTDTIRRIQRSNVHHEALYVAAREREEADKKREVENKKASLRDEVSRTVSEVAAKDLTPTFGYNAPKIGDGHLGRAEEIRREHNDEKIWQSSRP